MVSRRVRVAGSAILAAVVASCVLVAPAGATDPASTTAAAKAVAWLVTQQQADGGFEVAGFPGFETPDAVLAIAEGAQTGPTWSTAEALAAVQALHYGGSGGPTPLDALDAWAKSGINAGEASKLLLLVVRPLGLDPTDFGSSHTNLATKVYPSGCASPPDLTKTFFYEKMYAGFGGQILCGAPDAAILTAIRAAQRPEGGWNFNGSTAAVDPSDPFDPNMPDVDTTAIAVEVLVAGGAAWNDPALVKALGFLAAGYQPTGAFQSFGSDDPNATAVGMLAVAAAGFDPDSSCWRDTAAPASAGTPYALPAAWIRSQQQSDGHIASPNDGSVPNTFASAQSVEALLLRDLPMARATGAPTCIVTAPEVVSAPPASDPVELVPRFTG